VRHVPRIVATVAAGLGLATLMTPALGCSESPGVDTRDQDAAATATADAPPLPTIRLVEAFPALEFYRPVFLTHAGDGSGRLFVIEQRGTIEVFENRRDVADTTVFLDISEKIPQRRHNEEGLLALAFHPDYETNGHFYIYYTPHDPRRGVVSRFTVSDEDPNRADPASETVILEVDQPWGNHNGSTLLFGPDGYLYISLGDGGAAGDPRNNAQDLSTLLGTVLRIDVDNEQDGKPYAIPDDNPFLDREGARPEIWAYGLRNIWRMSFDRENGELWGGDVGQNRYEEIDLITRGGNYGWPIREGTHPFKPELSSPDPLIDPVAEYPRHQGISVTGGYVYRGDQMDRLIGAYLYGDYVSGRIWALRYEDGKLTAHKEVLTGNRRPTIASFGEDADGNLYTCSFDFIDGRGGSTGRIYRIEQN